MVVKRSLNWVNRALWTALVVVLVLLAVYVSLGRYYSDYIGRYQAEILTQLAERTGLTVEADQLTGTWSKLAPLITVDNLRLYSPQRPDHVVLSARQLQFKIDVLRSLLEWRIAVANLEAGGLWLELQEAEPGRWRLQDFSAGHKGIDFDALLDTLLLVHRARFADSEWLLHFHDGSDTVVTSERLALQRGGDFRRLDVRLRPAGDSESLWLLLEMQGDPRNYRDLSADLYVSFNQVDVTPLLPALHVTGIVSQQGRVDGELWASWHPGAEFDSRGSLRLPVLDLAGLSGRELEPLQDVALTFRARGEPGDWRAWLPTFRAEWLGQPLELSGLDLARESAGPLTVAVPTIELARWRDWVLGSGLLAPESLGYRALDGLGPAGQLRNVQLTVPLQQLGNSELAAELHQVALQPWQGAPGGSGIDGFVSADKAGGTVLLASDGMQLDLPDVYDHPLLFTRAQAALHWRIDEAGVTVQSGPIKLQSPDEEGPAVALLALDLPHDREQHAASMTLLVGLQDSAARYRDKYLPIVLEPDLRDWLDAAIVDGTVRQGAFVYRGSLRPGENHERTVQLFFDVADASLAYDPDWPRLDQVQARLWIDDEMVQALGQRAQVYDTIELSDIAVQVQPQTDGPARLVADAALAARDEDVLNVLRRTALRETVGEALDPWRWHGTVTGQLALDLALGSGGTPPVVDVDLQLAGGTLAMPDYRLRFTDIDGPLRYSSDAGLASPGIEGRWLDRELAATLRQADDGAVELAVAARLDAGAVLDWLELPGEDFAEGDTAFDVTVRFDNDNGSRLYAKSDLQGVAIELPEPLHKAGAETRPLELNLPLGQARQLLQLRVGDNLALDVLLAEHRVAGATLGLNAPTPLAVDPGWLTVTGSLAAFDAQRWQAALAPYLARAEGQPAEEQQVFLRFQDVHLQQVSWGERVFEDILLHGHQYRDYWLFTAANALADGELMLPRAATGPPRLSLKYLRLPASEDEQTGGWLAELEPGDLPDIDVAIAELTVGEDTLGDIAFELRSTEDGLRLERLHGELRELRFISSDGTRLHWLRSGEDEHTRLQGRAYLDDVGELMQAWRYEKVAESNSGTAQFDFDWPGTPQDFLFSAMQGELQLDVKDGRFLKTPSTTSGALKVVGIFNFANFLRRLQLDFSDLYKSGVSFDRVRGNMRFADGEMAFTEPLKIQGPSSSFTVSGRVDIVDDQTDLELVATLPIGTNLPWIVAIAGGLPAAAGGYVASKVFEETVDKFSSAVYEISGPWSDPEVNFKRIFDDNKDGADAAPAIADDGKESVP